MCKLCHARDVDFVYEYGVYEVRRIRSAAYMRVLYRVYEVLYGVYDTKHGRKWRVCQSRARATGEGECDRDLGVDGSLGRHVVESLGEVDVPLHAEPQLVHVTEVEHGLRVVLVLACYPVVARSHLIVYSCPPSVVVVVA